MTHGTWPPDETNRLFSNSTVVVRQWGMLHPDKS